MWEEGIVVKVLVINVTDYFDEVGFNDLLVIVALGIGSRLPY